MPFGSARSTSTNASAIVPMMTLNWSACACATAFEPPSAIVPTTRAPSSAHVRPTSQPRITASTSDGA
jgi:hypothetical protein